MLPVIVSLMFMTFPLSSSFCLEGFLKFLRVGLQAKHSLNFPSSENVLIPTLLLKNVFAEYGICHWCFFCFHTWKHCATYFQFLWFLRRKRYWTGSLWGQVRHFLLFAAFKIYSFPPGFKTLIIICFFENLFCFQLINKWGKIWLLLFWFILVYTAEILS